MHGRLQLPICLSARTMSYKNKWKIEKNQKVEQMTFKYILFLNGELHLKYVQLLVKY